MRSIGVRRNGGLKAACAIRISDTPHRPVFTPATGHAGLSVAQPEGKGCAERLDVLPRPRRPHCACGLPCDREWAGPRDPAGRVGAGAGKVQPITGPDRASEAAQRLRSARNGLTSALLHSSRSGGTTCAGTARYVRGERLPAPECDFDRLPVMPSSFQASQNKPGTTGDHRIPHRSRRRCASPFHWRGTDELYFPSKWTSIRMR